MKVLVIAPRTSGIGGIAYHTSKLIEHLRRKGNDVESISVENTPFLKIKGLMNPSFSLSSSAKVSILRLKGEKFDIVHAHNLPSALPMKLLNCKKVLTLHGVYSEQVSSLHGSFFGNLANKFEKKAIKWTNAFTVVSKSTKEFYEKLGFNVTYIPNAIDLEDMPKEKITLYEDQVTYVGRLSYEKGVDLLVEVAKRLPKLNFVLIGDGPLHAKLVEASKGLSNVHLLGYKPREEALKYLAGSRVFILPSRSEGLSTSILEAMALRVPVVATNVGGNLELVQDEVTGFLAESNNVESIVKSIQKALEGSSTEVTQRAYELIVSTYSWKVVIESYLSLYKKLLCEKN
ncbi:glycosyltransferase family 4 protein [archaeon]|jgi:glycosyltransferase involved in cell wall biosynthesis|nr:glycosyltransferase family 4 protein [archaeon]